MRRSTPRTSIDCCSNLLDVVGTMEITWLRLADESPLVGQTLADANLRARTGASVVAISRDDQLIPNPKSLTVFQAGDRIGLIGDEQQVDEVAELIRPSTEDDSACKGYSLRVGASVSLAFKFGTPGMTFEDADGYLPHDLELEVRRGRTPSSGEPRPAAATRCRARW